LIVLAIDEAIVPVRAAAAYLDTSRARRGTLYRSGIIVSGPRPWPSQK
jgi:hypothetical protein